MKITQHIRNLRIILKRCREYGISLNPEKSIFGVDKINLLGCIISTDEISVDPSKIETIKKIPLPRDKKAFQSFFGKINFIRRFIPNFIEIIKPLNNLLKKNVLFKWDDNGENVFYCIKKAITIAHVLVSQGFNKYFIILYFPSKDTIAEVLLQKNDERGEQPISSMSKVLKVSELNYTITEKQPYALVKSIKKIRTYVWYNKIRSFIPYPAVKDVLSQQDCLGSRGKCVSQIQEYDLEIKPTKIIMKCDLELSLLHKDK